MICRKAKCLRAFTLIELLVVIAIIALLLAIIMPALNKVKEQAKDLICRTNIKSIQLATILYTDDNKGMMPIYNLNGLWVNLISAYLDDVDAVRYCPSTKKKKDFDAVNDDYAWGSSKTSWVWNWGTPEPEHGSYGLNSWFYTWDPPATDTRYFHSMAEVKSTHMTPVFSDSLWIDVGADDTDTCPADLSLEGSPNSGGRMSMYLINRHGSHINVGFADGHQQVVELGALWSLKWHDDFQTTAWMERTDGTPIYRRSP